MRDEEIMFPGTFEYCERVVERPGVVFHWVTANQPIINIFNRVSPYFWVFDPELPAEEWVRQPPPYARTIEDPRIGQLVGEKRFPPARGKNLYRIIGLRTTESAKRLWAIAQSGSYLAKPDKYGATNARPIYDWRDGDVWLAHKEGGWDYNPAYSVMARFALKPYQQRIAPPTQTVDGIVNLQMAIRAWPRWYDRVCRRLPGMRAAAKFGRRAVVPMRQHGETWQECFQRTCIDEAPADWIKERAEVARDKYLTRHGGHSTSPFPEVRRCRFCSGSASWKRLAEALFNGDPFKLKCPVLKPMQPTYFRPNAREIPENEPIHFT